MTVQHAIAFGFLAGVLVCTLIILSVFIRFIASDLDGFRKWLDMEAPS